MKLCTKNQTLERRNSDVCTITEYPTGDNTIDFAIAKISGRYPENNQAVNTICKEIVYVQKGEGKVVVEGKEHVLKKGFLVLINPGEKFYWEGDMTLHISCTPAFSINQHQIISTN